MAIATNLGFPRIGLKRELKKAVEAYWAGKIDLRKLESETAAIRKFNWTLQKDAGIDHIPSNDFSRYDHVLDMCVLVGAIPPRYGWKGGLVDNDTYFTMARGKQGTAKDGAKVDLPAMEMTKWFDTNYHYIVPEFSKGQTFELASRKPFLEFEDALKLGIKTRPVLLGPFSFLKLGKTKGNAFNVLTLLPALLPIYREILKRLTQQGAQWIQIDEPCLALDQKPEELEICKKAYEDLKKAAGESKILLATYFEGLKDNLSSVTKFPVDGIHVDCIKGEDEIDRVLNALPSQLMLSLGVIDGRNIWKNDFSKSLDFLKKAAKKAGLERIMVAPSCSLLHSPVDLELEDVLDAELKNWLAFAKQKLGEISILTRALNEGEGALQNKLDQNKAAKKGRETSSRIHNPEVKARLKKLGTQDAKRKSPFTERKEKQNQKFKLPLFPSTTIGSFPQTTEIRSVRRNFKKGVLTQAEYDAKMKTEIKLVVQKQEEIGLDVLVHGEPERNDMVEYFGEQLSGFAFTQFGWVQSYGSRCVKPPIIFGDVSRPKAMTIDWITYAQSLTQKPMKGMLTGPITILQWSFVRNDQPRSETANQIALAIRDEVGDLEKAGIGIIQIDEPAIREGLPLRKKDWQNYLKWAVRSFRLSSSGVQDETQIHTHMCYSEFNDIIEAIGEMDADALSIEASRSDMELLEIFKKYKYPNDIGVGVYDIHSPRIPSVEEMTKTLEAVSGLLPPEQLWVNPDCGLKTRGWKETIPSLENMVEAGKKLRQKLASSSRQ